MKRKKYYAASVSIGKLEEFKKQGMSCWCCSFETTRSKKELLNLIERVEGNCHYVCTSIEKFEIGKKYTLLVGDPWKFEAVFIKKVTVKNQAYLKFELTSDTYYCARIDNGNECYYTEIVR